MVPPLISVITRTKDRPLLLKRALASVSDQAVPGPIEHCIVNDAGDIRQVNALLNGKSSSSSLNRFVLNREKSSGMEAASNAGIMATSGEFIAIHDDDDSWEPSFLETLVGFLKLPESQIFSAVVSLCNRVEEKVEETSVSELAKFVHNPQLRYLDLAAMLEENRIPPISLVFRRSVLDRVGMFDESLPVLGDWEFMLRLMNVGPVAVIPLALANYHVRKNQQQSQYGNSISAGEQKHRQTEADIRERWAESNPLELPKGPFYELSNAMGALAELKRSSYRLKERAFSLHL